MFGSESLSKFDPDLKKFRLNVIYSFGPLKGQNYGRNYSKYPEGFNYQSKLLYNIETEALLEN